MDILEVAMLAMMGHMVVLGMALGTRVVPGYYGIIYTQTFSFYFLYLISDHASKLLTYLFLLKLPYTQSWLEFPTSPFCCFKSHVHY